MFILIPSIIIFLCLSYIQLNDNISITTFILLFTTIGITVAISLSLYKKVRNDINLQDINSIIIEINRLNKLLQNTKDEKIILGLENKIKLLKKQKQNSIKNTQ